MQSYMLTAAKYDFSVYEKRILYLLVEIAQDELNGKSIKEIVGYKIQKTLFGDTDIAIPIRNILPADDDKNYKIAKKAFKDMANRTIEKTQGNIYTIDHILERVKVDTMAGVAYFRVPPNVWDIILDFTKGFRIFELKTIMNFKSVYSMRFYELISEQKSLPNFSLEYLREILCVGDKYPKTNDFIRKVILAAKRELDACSPYTFTYEPEMSGKKIVGFKFKPIYQQGFRDPELEKRELQKKVSISLVLDRRVLNYLRNTMLWPDASIKNNMELLSKAQATIPDFLNVLMELYGKARMMENPIGYVVNSLKGKIMDNSTGANKNPKK